MRHASCSDNSCNFVLIALNALYGMVEVPVEVSSRGLRETLKSPPRIRRPSWNEESFCNVALKNAWPALGAYILARVIRLPYRVPFTKMNRASPSM